MEGIKVVPEGDPKEGKPRATSEVRFPYFDLDTSIEVARAIHERAGGTCNLAQLATLLNYSSISNGSFRMRLSAAKLFGLVEGTDRTGLSVTPRGIAIVAPVDDADAERARLEAFLDVELFKRVYEKYNGNSIPPEAGLRNLLAQLGVVRDRVASTVRVMLDSAEQAGLFRASGNRSRMVLPLSVGAATARTETPAAPAAATNRTDQGSTNDSKRGGDAGGGTGGGDGGAGGGDVTIDAAILGLLRRLPPVGARLGPARRKAFIDAFTANLSVLYPEDEDDI